MGVQLNYDGGKLVGISVDLRNAATELGAELVSGSKCEDALEGASKPRRRRPKHGGPHYSVDDPKVASDIISAGFIDELRGVNDIDGKRIYFFNKIDKIKSIIETFDSAKPEDGFIDFTKGESHITID